MPNNAGIPIRVIAFPGAPNLPIFAAQEYGFFRSAGVDVTITTTPSSAYQAEKLALGEFDIALTAFDNVVAYSEGAGAVDLGADPGFRVIMGATQLEVSLVAASDIADIRALRGRSIALDALSTGFAYVLFDMLERCGVKREDCRFAAVGATPQRWRAVKTGEHAATMTIEPFTSMARRDGFNVLKMSSELYPSFQGGIVAAQQTWAEANSETVKRFIRGYLKGLEWTLDSHNASAAEQLLLSRMPEIQPQLANTVMRNLLCPRSGLTPAGAILRKGMAEVLRLRSRYWAGGRELTDVDKYLDLHHYDAVVKRR